ncbi:MAG: chitobiase/beta-hexosaminidase C-terminal domain-containing protein [Candidatus Cloacimonetes bacterium]|nr:chitobiase/beta-hexosaminidase C-terminal domain-containing protein [Candidatus Cloacimonadota bacterium]
MEKKLDNPLDPTLSSDWATIVFDPPGGSYTSAQNVSISCSIQDATIRYTTDGSNPSESSALYSSSITISQNTTIKVGAFMRGWAPSSLAGTTYNFPVDIPIFDPAEGTYETELSVSISSSTPDANIHYTTNNTEPTETSALYSSPITIPQNTTLKAKAFRSGWTASPTANANYILKVEAPIFNLPGGNYNSPQSVTITTKTPGAIIRYATNGSEPTESSTQYTAPIYINAPTNLKAKAFRSNWSPSNTTSVNYLMPIVAPTFNPQGGTYHSPQSVTMTTKTPGATIRYTTNGSEPTQTSTQYNSPISVDASMTLKAKAFIDSWTPSPTTSATYDMVVKEPTFSHAGGTYYATQNIKITTTTPNAIIRYTTDGNEPTEFSTQYTSPISVDASMTLKAKTYRNGWTPSSTTNATYIILHMIRVPQGIFIMGDTRGTGATDELPTHSVTLDSFYISKYPVTQGDYKEIMGSIYSSEGYGVGDNYPAYYVCWYDAIKYCNLLSMADMLSPVYSISGSTNPADWGNVPVYDNSTWNAVICNWNANGYRLPTEAEWEYAARSASNSPDLIYSGSNDINVVAWYTGNNIPNGTKPVGTKVANFLGACDMSGNVYEWCWDWYGNYSSGSSTNPTGPSSGANRVSRGGSWTSDANVCRVSSRALNYPSLRKHTIGFRVCRSKM